MVFMGDSIIRKVDKVVNRVEDFPVCLRDKNRGRSRKGRTGHRWWHGRCCSCACCNEQCREGRNVGHR